MAFTTRVWSVGKLLVLGGLLLATYVVCFTAAFRVAVKTRDVAVPNLTGRTINDASSVLAEVGLTLKVEEGRRIDPKIGAGRILSQDPPSGVAARRQRSVKVWLSAGPRVMSVPSLVGESERAAEFRLQQDALDLASVAAIKSGEYPTDAVIAQEPPPSTAATRVALLVNRGERGATYVMPDLIGVTGDRAAEIFRTRGFRVALVGDHPYPGVPAGVVLRQHPPAGFQIAPGEPISLEVSR